jgi:hypothetical protein
MVDSSSDAGTIQVLLERLNTQRLPRALEIKKKVDGGERLDDFDVQFLKAVLEDSRDVEGLAARHPEYKSLIGQLMGLYNEITRIALENEQKS